MRVLAWLSDEDWKIKAFRDFDEGIGHDIYVLTYARSFRIKPEVVIANKKTGDGGMRQLGKIMELALGFGGSKGAFAVMAAVYGVDLPESQVVRLVKAWRAAHPKIVAFWYGIEQAAKDVYRERCAVAVVNDIRLDMVRGWLRIRLPSGRYLSYRNFGVDEEGDLRYDGVNQYTRKWEALNIYGGKFAENITQAVARDILAYGMKRAEEKGFEICLHVHDELITEVPIDSDLTADVLSQRMSVNPSWSLGLPLAAAGYEAMRYRKE